MPKQQLNNWSIVSLLWEYTCFKALLYIMIV